MHISRTFCATLLAATLLLTGRAPGQDAAPAATTDKPAAPVKPFVNGKFLGNGKPAALAFVSAHEREPFSDKEAIRLVFTEKDHSASKKPDFDAAFGKFGNALILSVHLDGGIFGCEVRHSGIEKSPFSAIGKIKMSDFKIEGGNVTGSVSTGGPGEFFGEKWEVDLKFAASLPAKTRGAAAAPSKPATKAAADAPADAPDAPTAAPAGPRIAARSLPLPKDAADVQFKQLVGHIEFTSALPVDAVAKEFSAGLKKQGWKDGKGGLITKKSAILKREQGAAKLTIMIQPADGRSAVKIFTEGLDWEGAAEGNSPPKEKPAAKSDPAGDAEAQARKILEEALKKLPK